MVKICPNFEKIYPKKTKFAQSPSPPYEKILNALAKYKTHFSSECSRTRTQMIRFKNIHFGSPNPNPG